MSPALISYTWLIPVPPLISFFLIILLANRWKGLSHTIAIVSITTSFVLSWAVAFSVFGIAHFGEEVVADSRPWFDVGAGAFNMGVLVDPLTAIMLFFASLCMLAIFVYSVGYHNYGKARDAHDKPGWPAHNGIEPLYSRFFAYLSLFAFGMLVLIVADNLLLMFMGWEVMGLCSYLLIGFWYARKYDDPNKITPRQAAVKAFMTTRVADVIMLLGIVYLYFATGTLSFRDIMFAHEGEMLKQLASNPSLIAGLSQASLIGILLLIGTVGKSAQFPLHTWLPDAMEGPTPVSAMIHAAAMVSAGVYSVIRMYPVLAADGLVAHTAEAAEHAAEGAAAAAHVVITTPMGVLAFIGAFTALFAATIAVSQNDVKKVLAYSTISQLGFMLAALGIGGYVAAAFHLMTHAFFKALLFLGSGSIIHGMEHGAHHSHDHASDPQDMRFMGGLWKKMPVTFYTFFIGGMALAGLPFITAGFWSKDEILLDALLHAPVVFWTLSLAALLTAFYTTRQLIMVFGGAPRSPAAEHAHESSPAMTVPLVVLSVFAIFAGYLNVPEEFPVFGPIVNALGLGTGWFHHFIGGTLVEHPAALPTLAEQPWALVMSLTVALGGIALGALVYWRAWKTSSDVDPVERTIGSVLYGALKNKYWVDELYDVLFVKPAFWLGRVFFTGIDKGVIDNALHGVAWISVWLGNVLRDYFDRPVVNGASDGSGTSVKWAGRELRVIQTGRVQQYLVMVMIAAFVIGYFMWAAR